MLRMSMVNSLQLLSGFGLRLWSMDVALGTHGYHGMWMCVLGMILLFFFDFFNKKCNFFVKLFGDSKKSCTFVAVFSK